MRVLICGCLMLAAVVARAREGFYTIDMQTPEVIRKSWDAVFYLQSVKYNNRFSFGTAFLILTEKTGDIYSHYFLTSGHIIEQTCPRSGVCPRTTLSQSAYLEMQEDGLMIVETYDQTFFEVEVVDFSEYPDLALLRVRTKSKSPRPQPLKLASNCSLRKRETLYTIGFPNTPKRTDTKAADIWEQNIIYKRWSRGIFMSNLMLGDGQIFLGTTVDAIKGNSGGPVLTTKGEVVSVTDSIPNLTGYPYDGVETPEQLSEHLYGVHCPLIRKFISPYLPKH